LARGCELAEGTTLDPLILVPWNLYAWSEFQGYQTFLSKKEIAMPKSNLTKAQERIAEVAKAGAAGVKDVASDAVGAAASAAAGVVLQRVSETLAHGQQKVERAAAADRPPKAARAAKSKSAGRVPEPKPGRRKASPTRMKRAAATKKTVKKVASRNAQRRRSGTRKSTRYH
jgi:hypothetical protein